MKRVGDSKSGDRAIEVALEVEGGVESDVVLDVAESRTVFNAVVDVMEVEEWIMSGSGAGRGCAGSVIVFKAGAKTIGSRMC